MGIVIAGAYEDADRREIAEDASQIGGAVAAGAAVFI